MWFFSLFMSGSLLILQPLTPVEGQVMKRFVAPACQRCPGHRGISVLTATGGAVVAVADGEITFAGTVAGRSYVVQTIAKGIRMTYGWLAEIEDSIVIGSVVLAGQHLGRTGDITYLGVRVGATYVDPLPYLGVRRPRLVGFSPLLLAKVGHIGPAR